MSQIAPLLVPGFRMMKAESRLPSETCMRIDFVTDALSFVVGRRYSETIFTRDDLLTGAYRREFDPRLARASMRFAAFEIGLGLP